MEEDLFERALNNVISCDRVREGIGTYSEKTMHAVLKQYYEPDKRRQEQKVCGYVADILKPEGIIEIQTAGFDRLRAKLSAFLPVYPVTVVYPIPYRKWITGINPETGELLKRRKSPKTGSPYDIFPELYKIKPFLSNRNLSFSIAMVDTEEYRRPPETSGLKRGWRKGYTRYDRVPVSLCKQYNLKKNTDFLMFLPNNLPEEFTSTQLSYFSKQNKRISQLVLLILTEISVVERTGKKGNSYLYRIKKQ